MLPQSSYPASGPPDGRPPPDPSQPPGPRLMFAALTSVRVSLSQANVGELAATGVQLLPVFVVGSFPIAVWSAAGKSGLMAKRLGSRRLVVGSASPLDSFRLVSLRVGSLARE